MVYVLKQLCKAYSMMFIDYKDSRTDDWLSVNTPLPILIVLTAYLYLSIDLGPKWMKNRKPFNLKYVIAFYNLYQVIGNLGLMLFAWRWSYWHDDFRFSCALITPTTDLSERGVMVVYGCYYYFILKLSDLFDTAFFVLRKQTNHVSFLHVYHHSIMALCGYCGTRFIPGGQPALLVIVNCFVHVFMYAYYLSCSLGASANWTQWCKRHITHLQLFQFVVLTIHFSRSLINNDCLYPKGLSLILCIQNVFMMLMFLDFYRRTYLRPKSAKIKEKEINK